MSAPAPAIASAAEWRAYCCERSNALAEAVPEVVVSHSTELQILAHMAHCAGCWKRALDTELTVCSRCQGVAFCADCSSAGSSQRAHGCDRHLLAAACFGLISDFGEPLLTASESPMAEFLPFSDWGSYLGAKLGDFGLPEELLALAPATALLTDGLSLPLTIFHALIMTLGAERAARLEQCTVHLVGASVSEMSGIRKYINAQTKNNNNNYLLLHASFFLNSFFVFFF